MKMTVLTDGEENHSFGGFYPLLVFFIPLLVVLSLFWWFCGPFVVVLWSAVKTSILVLV